MCISACSEELVQGTLLTHLPFSLLLLILHIIFLVCFFFYIYFTTGQVSFEGKSYSDNPFETSPQILSFDSQKTAKGEYVSDDYHFAIGIKTNDGVVMDFSARRKTDNLLKGKVIVTLTNKTTQFFKLSCVD